MNNPIFEGACVAIVTPFTNNGIDFNKLEELIEFQIKESIDAILICGTTGESSTMPDEEHKSVVKFAVETINNRVPVIAGTGSNDTNHAIELSKYAESVGVDGLLLVSPYYNKTSQKGLYEHFKLIASNVKTPIILYNVPGRTGININTDTTISLSKIDNIVAIKECNFSQVGTLISKTSNDFSVYSGNDDQVIPLLSLGGKGIISVMANILPNTMHKMAKHYLSGETKLAREIQLDHLDLINSLFIEVSPIPVKEAMNLMGMNVGKCRMPLVDINDNNKTILKNTLQKYKLID